MKALLIKDLFTLKNNTRMILIVTVGGLVLAFATRDANYATMFIGMVLMQTALNTFSYDETCKWDQFAVTLPVTRAAVVREKYLLLLGGAGAAFVLSAIVQLILSIYLGSGANLASFAATSAAMVLVYLFALVLVLPVIYKIGIEKARYLFIAAIILPFFGLMYFSGFLAERLPWLQTLPSAILFGAAVVLVAAVFLASLLISTKIFQKKAF